MRLARKKMKTTRRNNNNSTATNSQSRGSSGAELRQSRAQSCGRAVAELTPEDNKTMQFSRDVPQKGKTCSCVGTGSANVLGS